MKKIQKIEKNYLLQILSIKNPFYSKFYSDSNAKNRFSFQPLFSKVTVTVMVTVTVTVTVTIICILLFLAHNGEGTVWEGSRNYQKKLVTMRERSGTER